MEMVNEIKKLVDAKKEAFLHAGDLVWEYAEIGFKEFQSAKALTDVLKAEGGGGRRCRNPHCLCSQLGRRQAHHRSAGRI